MVCGRKGGIVAFAFGTPSSIRSNVIIAKIASRKARELKVPVYTQQDVVVDPEVEVFFTDEKSGEPPPTLRISRGAVSWAKKTGLRHLWICAASPHLWRCRRDFTRAILETGLDISIWAFSETGLHHEDVWFCPDSTQKRTRSREAWEKRERILRIMPFFIYKFVAS
jgi:hypothetical protein